MLRGTKGSFDLIANAIESEVDLVYNIDIDVSNIPENLKFYSDEHLTKKIISTDGKIRIEDCFSINDPIKQQTKRIYWNWKYETGLSEYEKSLNDEKDSRWMGKLIYLDIDIKAKQVTKSPQYLANNVQIGDYVNYDSSSGIYKQYTTSQSETGSDLQSTFTSNDEMRWRVLYVDQITKTVELISADSTEQTLNLYGKKGYKNGKQILNNIGEVFGNGNGAYSGRSLTVEDVNYHSQYDCKTFTSAYGYTYGHTLKYNIGEFIMEDGMEFIASEENNISITQSFYSYILDDYISDRKIYNMLIFNSDDINYRNCWLASPYADFSKEAWYVAYGFFHIRRHYVGVHSNYPEDFLYRVGRGEHTNSYSVTPVVTLKSNMRTIGNTKDENNNTIWKLDN